MLCADEAGASALRSAQLGFHPGAAGFRVLGVGCSLPAVVLSLSALGTVLGPAVTSHGWVEVSLSELQFSGGAFVSGRSIRLGGAVALFEWYDSGSPRVVQILNCDVHFL